MIRPECSRWCQEWGGFGRQFIHPGGWLFSGCLGEIIWIETKVFCRRSLFVSLLFRLLDWHWILWGSSMGFPCPCVTRMASQSVNQDDAKEIGIRNRTRWRCWDILDNSVLFQLRLIYNCGARFVDLRFWYGRLLMLTHCPRHIGKDGDVHIPLAPKGISNIEFHRFVDEENRKYYGSKSENPRMRRGEMGVARRVSLDKKIYK